MHSCKRFPRKNLDILPSVHKEFTMGGEHSCAVEREHSWRCAVMEAVKNSDISCLDTLLKRKGQRSLDFTIDCGYGTATLLTKAVDVALYKDNYQMMEQLLSAGASVDFPRKYGTFTPLIYACQWRNVPTHTLYRTCSILLRYGANVNKKASDLSTALSYAVEAGHSRIASLFLEHGAEVFNSSNLSYSALSHGRSPIYLAISKRRCSIFTMLITHCRKIGQVLPLSWLFRMAVNCDSENCAIIVLEEGYYPNDKSLKKPNAGRFALIVSPFLRAVCDGHVTLMTIMIELNPQFLQETWLVQKQTPELLSGLPGYVPWLTDYRKQVPDLQKLCKSMILSQLDTYYKPKIDKLPLPTALKTYLCAMEPTWNKNSS